MTAQCTHCLALVNTIQNNDSATNKKSMKVSRIIIHRCFSPTKAGHSKVKTFVIVIIVAEISLHTNTPDNGVNDVTTNLSSSTNMHHVTCSNWSLQSEREREVIRVGHVSQILHIKISQRNCMSCHQCGFMCSCFEHKKNLFTLPTKCIMHIKG